MNFPSKYRNIHENLLLMDNFWLGLNNLLDLQVLMALFVGAIGGMVIGAIPGIGPAIAISILLPATIFLPDLVSLILLLGVCGSSMYGGAILPFSSIPLELL